MRTAQPGRVVGGRILTIALLSSVIAAAGRADAATRTWIGMDGANWSVGTNWLPNGPLAVDDDLVFPAFVAGSSVNDHSGTLTVRSITFVEPHVVTGGTIALTGSLSVAASTAVTISSGLALTADQTWTFGAQSWVFLTGAIDLGNRQWTVDASASSLVSASFVTGTGAIIKNGDGHLRLTGANDFHGPLTINQGAITAMSSDALGFTDGTAAHGTTVNGGGVLKVDGVGMTLNEALVLNGGGPGVVVLDATLAVYHQHGPVTLTSRSAITGTINFHTPITGTGALEIAYGLAILHAAGSTFPAVYFSGPGGQLRANASGAIPTNLAIDLPASFVLDLNGFSAYLSSLTGAGRVKLGANAATALTVDVAASTTQVFTGEIEGAGQLAKTGAGELVLGGANGSFTGDTYVLQGRLRITHPLAVGPFNMNGDGGTRVSGNATFTIDGVSPVVTEAIVVQRVTPTDTPILEVVGSAPVTFQQTVALNTGAIVRGSGGANITLDKLWWGGAVTIENVAVQLIYTQSSPAETITIGSGATLHAGSNVALPSGVSVAIAETGTLALNGEEVRINGLTGTGTLSLGTDGEVDLRGALTHTFGGTITGSGTFKKSSSGDFTLAGPTTFTGPVYIYTGRLIVAHKLAIAANPINVVGAALVYDISADPTGPINLWGTGPVDGSQSLYARGGDVVFSGAVKIEDGGSSSVRVDAPNVLVFQGPIAGTWLWVRGTGTAVIGSNGSTLANLGIGFAPAPTPNSATVRVNAPNALVPELQLRVDEGATFDLNGFAQKIGGLFGKGRVALGSGTLTLESGVTLFDGTFSGTGALVASVPHLSLKGTHTLTGSVTVNGSFALNGTLPASITVNLPTNGGAGFGPGTIAGPVTVNGAGFFNTGNLATPGGPTLGGLTLSDTTTWSAPVHGGGVLLTVNGPVSIDGARLFPTLGNGVTVPPATPIMLIANDGTDAIGGTFKDVPEGSSVPTISGTFRVSYVGGTGNDATLVMPRPGYHLSEGATGPFFDTELLIANPNDTSVTVDITLLPQDGEAVTHPYTLAPLSRVTILVDEIPGFEHASFSTVVRPTTDAVTPLVVERTMRWGTSGYGAHTEKATFETPDSGWTASFAEGSEGGPDGFFHTFLLLENPHASPSSAFVTYMRENEPPITREYPLKPASRLTVVAADDPDLVGRSFGIDVWFWLPGMAERAMYFGADPIWAGGHASAGASALSTTWFLAEGATGGIFDTFILVANPNTEAADVTMTFLPEGGTPATLTRKLEPFARMTINPAVENLGIAPGPVATHITATRPVIAERSQYWSAVGGPWNESHNSLGVTAAATKWGLAEGRAGGPEGYQTYVLLANTGTEPANVTLKFLGDGASVTPVEQTVVVGGQQRKTVRVDPIDAASEAAGMTFGTVITSDQPIVVERALYWNPAGQLWGAGTNATATRLP